MLTSPALLSMVSSRSASTRAISTRSAGWLSRPGSMDALLVSRLVDTDSSEAAAGAASSALGVTGAAGRGAVTGTADIIARVAGAGGPGAAARGGGTPAVLGIGGAASAGLGVG